MDSLDSTFATQASAVYWIPRVDPLNRSFFHFELLFSFFLCTKVPDAGHLLPMVPEHERSLPPDVPACGPSGASDLKHSPPVNPDLKRSLPKTPTSERSSLVVLGHSSPEHSSPVGHFHKRLLLPVDPDAKNSPFPETSKCAPQRLLSLLLLHFLHLSAPPPGFLRLSVPQSFLHLCEPLSFPVFCSVCSLVFSAPDGASLEFSVVSVCVQRLRVFGPMCLCS